MREMQGSAGRRDHIRVRGKEGEFGLGQAGLAGVEVGDRWTVRGKTGEEGRIGRVGKGGFLCSPRAP